MKTRVSIKYFVTDCKFTYSPLGKDFGKQTKSVKEPAKKTSPSLKSFNQLKDVFQKI